MLALALASVLAATAPPELAQRADGDSDADRFPLKVDPQRGTAARFQPSEEAALFLFELRGVPVGTVELRLDRAEGKYTYRSRHLYARAQDRTWVVKSGAFDVDRSLRIRSAGVTRDAFPESLWLWRKPTGTGCVTVHEELGPRKGEACASELHAEEVRGTLYGEDYVAFYADGWLQSLQVGQARFLAVPPNTDPKVEQDLFATGFAVGGKPQGTLALRPPLALALPGPNPAPDAVSELSRWDEAEARALAAQVHADFVDKRPTSQDFRPGSVEEEVFSGSCLAHAKRFAAKAAAQGQQVAIVHGLWVENGEDRAFPHAWVRVRVGWRKTLDLDPTFLDEVKPQTHLPVYVARASADDTAAGKVWLELLAGRYRITRGLGRP